MLLERLAELWSRVSEKGWAWWLKAYVAFAVGHTVVKVLGYSWTRKKNLKPLMHLKGKEPDLTLKEVVQNIHRYHDWRMEYILETGPADLVKTPNPLGEVMCMSPEAVKVMLQSEFNTVSKSKPDSFYPFLLFEHFVGSKGIFALRHGSNNEEDNALWYVQRKDASKLFSRSNFENLMYETILDKCKILQKVVGSAADKNDSINTLDRNEGAEPVDMQEKFFCFTFDAIQKIFYNRNVDSLGAGKQDEYAQAFDLAHREMLNHTFRYSGLAVITTHLLPFPFGSLTRSFTSFNPLLWIYRSCFDVHYQQFMKHCDYLHTRTLEFVQEARTLRENQQDRKDLLSFFLNSKHEYTDRELRDIVLNFILAGRDTTACALTWMFYELSIHQDVQDKIVEEIRSELGRDGVPTLENISKLKYLNCVLMETLRLHPPVPEDGKSSYGPLQFPDGTIIPEGIRVTFDPYTMGRDPKRYDDPLCFKPERWMDRPEPSMYEFPVFQAGPRFCLGKDFAKHEAKIVTCMLLNKFSFHLEQNERPENITYSLMITMSLVNSIANNTHNLWLVPKHRH